MSEMDECPICDNKENNHYFKAKEMMLQLSDEFDYLQCSNCGCMSLLKAPENMGIYYPENYYSFTQRGDFKSSYKFLKKFIRKSAMKAKLGDGNIFDKIISNFKTISFPWLRKNLVSLNSKILDVGSGNGILLEEMKEYGFSNLTGIDPFGENKKIDPYLKLFKTDIHSLEDDNFDMIMYHHSFEHVQDPVAELKSIFNKLNNNGNLILRIPVCDSYAFRKYQQNWVQLDAPRHYYLHTEKSMQILAENTGFRIESIEYDSNSFQFTGSECYVRGLQADAQNEIFSKEEISQFEEQSIKLNEKSDGDSACFYLKKSNFFH